MTAEECERWDNAERIRDEERRATWEEFQRQHARERLDGTRRKFRRFDDQSSAACPWTSRLVTFIALAGDGPVTFANDVAGKAMLLTTDYEILVAWPGEYSQHIFLLDPDQKAQVLRENL